MRQPPEHRRILYSSTLVFLGDGGMVASIQHLASHHSVQQTATRPNVSLLIVRFACDDLGGNILQGSAHLLHRNILLEESSQPEVYQLHLGADPVLEHDVLRLDVSMYDPGPVQIGECTQDLRNVSSRAGLSHGADRSKTIENVTSTVVVQHQVNLVIAFEQSLKPHNGRVGHLRHRLNFLQEAYPLLWRHPSQVEGLHGHRLSRSSAHCLVDFS
mmetsp:Transcript_5952/g.13838  ORF Transcript_5952/g.13838 Transcript_5952/m.13838 type:complete len:215 (-) Transcript_5952:293-937(-)